ncbi:aminotransferase class I/II-fold pyridoxal phosphate-dependent enzyme [Patescibacteria group bacterium]
MSNKIDDYIKKAEISAKQKQEYKNKVKKWNFDTIAVHGIYSIDEAMAGGAGIVEPIVPSTSQAFRDSDELEAALAYKIPAWGYSRIHNPTIHYLEETLSLLETYGSDIQANAICTSSGMSAIKQAVEPLVAQIKGNNNPINFVSATQVYGGSFQLFSVRMPERGVEPRWIRSPWDIEEWKRQIDENTRFLYAEMPSNPQQACFDIEKVADLAHQHNIPLIVDGTIATPALLRPLTHGADIVVHSITKTIGSSGSAIGGAIIAKHNIISKHLNDDQKGNYALWLKLLPARDSGPCMSSFSAYQFLCELKTLRIRMEHFSKNTQKVVEYLSNHPKIEKVDYLGLENHPLHSLAKKYMKLADTDQPMFGHLCSFNYNGSVEETRQFFDNLQIISRATDLGRIKSVATIPAISTHQQQGEEGRELANIPPNMIRLCVGGENAQDIINDLDQALANSGRIQGGINTNQEKFVSEFNLENN